MAERPDLEECWDWFSRVKHTLGDRCRIASCAKRALLLADDGEKADLVRSIELMIAEIDADAITADELGVALVDSDAVQALNRVSKKLDRLSSELVGFIVDHGAVLPNLLGRAGGPGG